MTPRIPQIPDAKVLDWLGLDANGVPYYLHPLNLVWSKAGAEHDLEVFRRVAAMLAAEPGYWAEIIRDAGWRYSLAGCTCLLASRSQEFYEDLCYRFRADSFVTPQIAVTLGLLHPARSPDFFAAFLDDHQALRRSPKQSASAYHVLLRLGVQPPHNITTDLLTQYERDESMIADHVINEHWKFWSSRV